MKTLGNFGSGEHSFGLEYASEYYDEQTKRAVGVTVSDKFAFLTGWILEGNWTKLENKITIINLISHV